MPAQPTEPSEIPEPAGPTVLPAPAAQAPGQLALARSATDRDAQRRSDPGLLEELAADPSTRLVLVDARGRVALDAPGRVVDPPQDGLAPPDARPARGRGASSTRDTSVWEGYAGEELVQLPGLGTGDLDLEGLSTYYLGRDLGGDCPGRGDSGRVCPGAGASHQRGSDQAPQDPRGSAEQQEQDGVGWLAVVVPASLGASEDLGRAGGGGDAEAAATDHPDLRRLLRRHPLAALRSAGAQMSAHEAGLAVAASALAAWHASSSFCPACGGRTRSVQAGWARQCTGCQATHFPRTDPAVIMAVTDDADRLLLVHGATWEDNRYSVVAGFVEAGESAESAVCREVMEETGLRVERVDYVASQPWPFPRSLMLGYRARLAPGERLARPDGQEVTGALLVSREELVEAVARRRVILPGRTSFGRFLVEGWLGGPLSG